MPAASTVESIPATTAMTAQRTEMTITLIVPSKRRSS
jgi:hypothetical protein